MGLLVTALVTASLALICTPSRRQWANAWIEYWLLRISVNVTERFANT
jgi:hypothetical protein